VHDHIQPIKLCLLLNYISRILCRLLMFRENRPMVVIRSGFEVSLILLLTGNYEAAEAQIQDQKK
jgi:hypothetical protein